jgi:hypothetical protein
MMCIQVTLSNNEGVTVLELDPVQAVFPLSLSFNFCVVTPLVLAPHPGLHSDGKYLIMLMLSSSVPDPPVFGPSGSVGQGYWSGSFYHQAKNVRKPLIPTVLWLLLVFLSLKNDVNVPSKTRSNKQKTFFKFDFCCVLKVSDENSRIRIQ